MTGGRHGACRLPGGGLPLDFNAHEGSPREPVHIHAARPGGDARLWLYPGVRVAYKRGLSSRELRELEAIATERQQEFTMPGTPFSPKATSVRFDEDSMWVSLDDGRVIGVPLAWYPRLLKGSVAARHAFFLSPSGIHWDELDEDIAIDSLLAARVHFPTAQAA